MISNFPERVVLDSVITSVSFDSTLFFVADFSALAADCFSSVDFFVGVVTGFFSTTAFFSEEASVFLTVDDDLGSLFTFLFTAADFVDFEVVLLVAGAWFTYWFGKKSEGIE